MDIIKNSKRGFTLIEMLTTTAIMVIVFGLLAVIFSRATVIHKVVRSGGDAENFGIYLLNTMVYGHGINREESLVGAKPLTCVTLTTSADATCADTLTFRSQDGKRVQFILDGSTVKHLVDPDLASARYVDLKPSWAKDRQLEILLDSAGFSGSKFRYYKANGTDQAANGDPVYYVDIILVLKNALQNNQEAITLYQRVRIRNQIDF